MINLGVVDESIQESPAGDRWYVLALIALQLDALDGAQALVGDAIGARQRPFHWTQDRGPVVRERLLPALALRGIDFVRIEQRSRAQDEREIKAIRDWYRARQLRMPDLKHVGKSSSDVWLADAVAGAWGEKLVGRDSQWAEFLVRNAQIGELWCA